MVLHLIKNLLSTKDILKTVTSSGINNYIRICKDSVLKEQQWRTKKNRIR